MIQHLPRSVLRQTGPLYVFLVGYLFMKNNIKIGATLCKNLLHNHIQLFLEMQYLY